MRPGSSPDGALASDASSDAEALPARPWLTPVDPGSGPFERCGVLGFGAPTSVALSPDGSLLAIAGSGVLSVLRAEDGAPVGARIAAQGEQGGVAFLADGSLASAFSSALLQQDPRTGRELSSRSNVGGQGLTFSSDGQTLAWLAGGNIATLQQGQTQPALYGAAGLTLDTLALSPDGALVATAVVGTVSVWRVGSRERLAYQPPLRNAVSFGLHFSADGQRLSVVHGSGTGDGVLLTLDAHTGAVLATQPAPYVTLAEQRSRLLFAPDGERLFVTRRNAIERWRLVRDGAALATPELELSEPVAGWATAMALSSDGNTLVAATASEVSLLDLTGRRFARAFDGVLSTQPPIGWGEDGGPLRFSPDGLLVVAAHRGTVRAWDTATWRERQRFERTRGAWDFAPEGASLYLSSASAAQLERRSLSDGSLLEVLPTPGLVDEVRALERGRALAVATSGSPQTGLFRRVLGAGDGWQSLHPAGGTQGAATLLPSPDGALLAAVYFTRGYEVFAVPEGRSLYRGMLPSLHSRDALAFSPDGAHLAALDNLLAPSDGALQLAGPLGANATATAWSPGGDLRAVGTYSGLELRDPSGARLQRLDDAPHSALAHTGLSFSADGSRLASAGVEGIVRLYCRR